MLLVLAKYTTPPPLGDLGTLIANRNGEAEYSGSKPLLKVADLVGRSLVVYKSEEKHEPGITAATQFVARFITESSGKCEQPLYI